MKPPNNDEIKPPNYNDRKNISEDTTRLETFNEKKSTHDRKLARINIAKSTIKYCFILLSVIFIAYVVGYIVVGYAYTMGNKISFNGVTDFIKAFSASIVGIITLCLGFIAGTSID